jgi:hypothetical protein
LSDDRLLSETGLLLLSLSLSLSLSLKKSGQQY